MKEKIENTKILIDEIKEDFGFEEENERALELISIIEESFEELEFILDK